MTEQTEFPWRHKCLWSSRGPGELMLRRCSERGGHASKADLVRSACPLTSTRGTRLRRHSLYVETSENSGQDRIRMPRGWVMPLAPRERALGPPRPPQVPLPLADPDSCPGKQSCRQSAFLVLRVTLNYCPQGGHGNPGIYRLWSEGRRTEA